MSCGNVNSSSTAVVLSVGREWSLELLVVRALGDGCVSSVESSEVMAGSDGCGREFVSGNAGSECWGDKNLSVNFVRWLPNMWSGSNAG